MTETKPGDVVATVAQCWRYPVKSMLGERLTSVDLGPLGIAGDRVWATRDLVRGGIRGAKKIGPLMHLAARTLATGEVAITVPDGRTVLAGADEASDVVSEAVGHPVRLEALAPADDRDHYRRGPADDPDLMGELRATFALEEHDPLPDFSKFPPDVVEFESPPGTYYDCWPLVLITDASLAHLQALAPTSAIDVRRFRPSLLLHTDAEGFAEQAWVGRSLQVGSAVIEVLSGCPRCVMITRPVSELPEDRSIMRTLVREAGQDLGVYARVTVPGRVGEGDACVVV
jgi:uncharacterized protein YcbX